MNENKNEVIWHWHQDISNQSYFRLKTQEQNPAANQINPLAFNPIDPLVGLPLALQEDLVTVL